MGGRIAQWLAVDRPDAVVSLVLGGTRVGDRAAFGWPPESERALRSGDLERLAQLFYPQDWIDAHPAEVARVRPAARSMSASAAHLRASSTYDGPPPADIAVPTLVVHGSDDRIAVVDNAELLAAEIPDARLLVVDGARHAYWAGRDDVHAAVRDFLAAHDRRPRAGARAGR